MRVLAVGDDNFSTCSGCHVRSYESRREGERPAEDLFYVNYGVPGGNLAHILVLCARCHGEFLKALQTWKPVAGEVQE